MLTLHNRSVFAGQYQTSKVTGSIRSRSCYSRRCRNHTRAMMGFNFGDDDTEPDIANSKESSKKTKLTTLGTLSSSLLIFGPVLKGAVGEAFLAALAITAKYQASNKEVLGAFTKFYSLLLQAGFSSWEEYLIDQILLGRDNAFARSVAQGNIEDGAPVLKAVAYDLDVLQQLSVPMARVAEFIGDAAPVAGPYWVAAASSVSVKCETKQLQSSSSPLAALNMSQSSFIQKPATSDELKAWMASISGKSEWSEAVLVLQQYFHLHGFGITSRNSALRWSKGAFEEGSEGNLSLTPLSVLKGQTEQLSANTIRFCDGLPAHHCLIAGPSGSAKSWLLWESTLIAGKDKGVRVVEVPSQEQGALLEVARGAGRYPRLRFIIVVDNLDLPLRGGLAADLMSGLSAACGPSGWPSNALLYVGASPNSTISFDNIVSRFGLVLTTGGLNDEEFGQTLLEMADQPVPQEHKEKAIQWAKSRGGLTVRNAWMYIHHLNCA